MTADAWPAPVLPGFRPDPSVCRVDGSDGTWYYLVNSSFEYAPGLPVHRSRDLRSWEHVGSVVQDGAVLGLASVQDSGGLFAPTIRHDGRRFVVVCTVVGSTARDGHFVTTSSDPAGPWSAPVWWDVPGIDPSLLIDSDGSWWAHGTRSAAVPEWDQQTEIWVRRADPETLRLHDEEHVVWTGALRGGIWSEGPHLYRRAGHYVLLTAEGGTGGDHAVCVARSESPTGPFEGDPRNPVLTHRHLGSEAPITCVGHADLVDDPSGRSWALCLGMRPRAGSDPLGRETFLVDVVWEDGWPVFAPGVGRLHDVDGPAPEPSADAVHAGPPAPAASCGELLGVRHSPRELGVRRGPDDAIGVPAGSGLDAQRAAFVGSVCEHLDAEHSVLVADRPHGVRAGLALRLSRRAHAVLSVDDDGAHLEVADSRGGTRSVLLDHTPRSRARLAIRRIGGTMRVLIDEREFELPPELSDIRALCTAQEGGFTGAVAGVLAVALDAAAEGADTTFRELRESTL